MAQVARTVLLVCLLTAAALPAARAKASTPPPVEPPGPRFVWSDPQGLVPLPLIGRLTDELAALGRTMGVEMGLAAPGVIAEPARRRYRVKVMRAPKDHWLLRGDVMAAAPRTEGHRGTIYLFLERVQRTLGHLKNSDSSDEAREHTELAKALARILAHELVHIVAPDHPHAKEGLMVARLRRSLLLHPRAGIDPACARAFRDALASD